MVRHILFDEETKQYSLTKGVRNIPPPFSLDDKYAHLKRKAKYEEYKKKGLIHVNI